MAADAPALTALHVAGGPQPWETAGFTTESGDVVIGTVTLHTGAPGEGISAWTLTGVDDGVLDGLTTFAAGEGLARRTPQPDDPHPNTTIAIDHLVVISPDLDRTTEAFGGAGIELRRIREAGPGREQRFFRVGEVILELIGEPGAAGPGPSTFWGLALTVADLEATADLLGEHLGPITDAVQPGRRIATLRREPLGIPVSIAFMTAPPPRRPS